MSYSQLGQDTAVLNAYPDRVGYFVDIGAYVGKEYSNTLLLEEKGWTGICAEPSPPMFEELKKNRKFCFLTDKAVWHTTGETVEFAVVESGGQRGMLSGITGFSTGEYKAAQDKSRKVQVKTVSLNDLLVTANAPKFMEYLSLDTEGTEYDILKALDFSKWVFGLIDVEHNFEEAKRESIRRLLESNGYVFLRQNKWDDCYIHHTQTSEVSV